MATYPYDQSFAVEAFGLHNVGNSCYFNSLVQSLLSCPILRQFLLSVPKNRVIDAFNAISTQSTRHVGDLLRALIDASEGSSNTLHYNWQEDAHEGLVLLLDKMGEGIEHLFNVRYNTTLVCATCGKEEHKAPDVAKCEVFVDYYDDEVDLEKYIHNHCTTPEDYKCEKCEEIETTVCQKTLRRISTIVVLTLKKYHGKKHVNFPLDFTINGGKIKLHYKIVAQIEHTGTMGGGHYYAKCLRADGKVYVCNDSSVAVADRFDPTPNTYMVFYHLDTKSCL